MITAVDTNVLLDILGSDVTAALQAQRALEKCLEQGSLTASLVVYAELSSRFPSEAALDRFLAGFALTPTELSKHGAFLAGTLLHSYWKRGGMRDRIIADFLVGAHALGSADRLLTRDRGFYSPVFGKLRVISPLDFS